MNKIVVYSAITGNRDFLRDEQVTDGADFICFTDNASLRSNVWEIRKACNLFNDSNRNAKMHKVLAHKYLRNYKYSLWIDGNLNLKVPVKSLIEKYLVSADLALYKHHEFTCMYNEVGHCISRKLDNVDNMEDQVNYYKNLGYPSNHGLFECSIILRHHTFETEELNNYWWTEICRYSKRDQSSFNYVAWELGTRVKAIEGNIKDNIYFRRGPHG